nr:class I SAM-dependent methyltransferase [Actinomycetales bacterium]
MTENAGLRRLLTSEGQALLSVLPPYDPAIAMRLNEELRKVADPELVAAALTQQHLRQRAEAKLGEFARTLLFTEAGLQQATRLEVAAQHARRYRDAGIERVYDLGCGLGIDSLALAALGLGVTAVEADEATAALATYNLRTFENARVIHGDALEVAAGALGQGDGAYADPARRTSTGRTFDPAAYSPPLGMVLDLRERTPALGVKAAPGIGYEHLPEDVHAQWVSVGGSVVEAGLWFGPLAPGGPGRSALVIGPHGHADLAVTVDPRSPAAAAPVVEEDVSEGYLVEPDGAVIRAGGVAALAALIGGRSVSEGIAYLAADEPHRGPFGESFEVLEAFPYSRARLSAWCRREGIGALEIKKRGVDVVPDQLRKALRLRGPNAATVILTRVRGRHHAIVARRVVPNPS